MFVARHGIVWGREQRHSPSLSLGCNVWNGVPLRYDFVAHTVPRHVVSYPRSTWNDTVVCEGFVPTSSVTATVPFVFKIDFLTFVPDVSSSSSLAAGVSFAAALGAVVAASGAAPVAALDSQVLGAIGSSSCAPSALRVAAGPSRFSLSPFASLGPVAMVLGNVMVAGVIVGLHVLVVRVLQRREEQQRQMSSFPLLHHPRMDQSDPTGAPVRPEGVVPPPPSHSSTPPVEVRMHFPNLSYGIVLLFIQGVGNASIAALGQGDAAGVTVGCAGVLAIVAAGYLRSRYLWIPTRDLFVFQRYRLALRRGVFPLSEFVLPLGRWGRQQLRTTHGRLRGAVRGGAESLALFNIIVALIKNVLLGIPLGDYSLCGAMWGVLCAVCVIAAGVVAWYRPCRAPIVNAFMLVGYILMAVIFLLNLLLYLSIQSLAVLEGIGTVTLLLVVSTLIKSAHAIFVTVWERKMLAKGAAAVIPADKQKQSNKNNDPNNNDDEEDDACEMLSAHNAFEALYLVLDDGTNNGAGGGGGCCIPKPLSAASDAGAGGGADGDVWFRRDGYDDDRNEDLLALSSTAPTWSDFMSRPFSDDALPRNSSVVYHKGENSDPVSEVGEFSSTTSPPPLLVTPPTPVTRGVLSSASFPASVVSADSYTKSMRGDMMGYLLHPQIQQHPSNTAEQHRSLSALVEAICRGGDFPSSHGPIRGLQ